MTRDLGTALAIASLFCLTNFANAATDSTSIAISATVPSVLSITADLPAVVPIPAAVDINAGSVTIQSNDPDGFSFGFRSTSGGSSLVEPNPAITDAIDYEV